MLYGKGAFDLLHTEVIFSILRKVLVKNLEFNINTQFKKKNMYF